MGVLDDVVVIEIGGIETLYAGKLLADQGADVILAEPSGGHASRRLPPYAGDRSHATSSTVFTYYNGNKRSVVIEDGDGAGIPVRRLVERADIVLAGGRPTDIRRLGIDPEDMPASQPDLILTTVTPFGWTGPYSDHQATDMTLQAMGGLMNMGGYHDGRPLRPPAGQSYVAAGIYAAIGSLGAVLSRDVSGYGQHVDVSVQESVVMALENSAQFFDLEGTVRTRHGGAQVQAARGVYACKDGYIYLMAGVRAEAKFWKALLAWFEADGTPGREQLEGEHWLERDYVETEEAKDIFNEVFTTFLADKTKAEVDADGRKRGIPLAPVNDLGEVLESEQLRERGFFEAVPATEWAHGPGVVPGAPYRMSATPWRSRTRPRRVGEDTTDFLAGAQRTTEPAEADEQGGQL